MMSRILPAAILAAALAALPALADPPQTSELDGEHEKAILFVAWSPDGTMLASAGDDKTIVVWDVKAGGRKMRLGEHDGSVCSFAWSPDGKQIAGADAHGPIRIWDLGRRKQLKEIEGHGGGALGVAWSPKGDYIASTGHDGVVKIIDAKTWSEVRSWKMKAEGWGIAFNADGTRLCVVDEKAGVGVYDVTGWRLMYNLRGHTDQVRTAHFSPNGKMLATASLDGTVRLWDMETGRAIRTLPVGDERCTGVAFRPDSKQIATGCHDGTVKVWEAATGNILEDFDGFKDNFASVAWSPDGKVLAAGGGDKSVHLWSWEPVARPPDPPPRRDDPPRVDPPKPPPPEPPKPDKSEISRKQIKDLDAALKAFQAENGYLPHSVNSGMVVALSGGRRGGFYRFNREELNGRNEVIDAWGNPLIYHSPGSKGAAFDLFSCGPNGKDDCGAGDDIGNW